MRAAAGYGNGRSSTASTTLKIAVHAPMPSASESTAAAVKPGRVRNMRAAYLRSCHSLFIAQPSSFVSQCHHRIDLRGASGRHVAGQEGDAYEQQRDEREDGRVGGADAIEQAGQYARQGERGADADADARERERHALPDDEAQHVARLRAQSHAHADL